MKSRRRTSRCQTVRIAFWPPYETGSVRAYYVEPVGVGDALPDMPLFLANSWHVPVPLEPTYQTTWDASPEDYRTAVETGVMPELDAE